MIKFYKIHGAHNNFIVINNREGVLPEMTKSIISNLCSADNGIGADGLLILEDEAGYDFKMRYYNADGSLGEMCGNGARCLIYLENLLTGKESVNFIAEDGEHKGWILDNAVKVSINASGDSEQINAENRAGYFINSGVPHFVTQITESDKLNLHNTGRFLRHSNMFPDGANINFYEIVGDTVMVRTYERGVEAETMACGTGAVAVAVALNEHEDRAYPIQLQFPGGVLSVGMGNDGDDYYLTGPVKMMYEAYLNL